MMKMPLHVLLLHEVLQVSDELRPGLLMFTLRTRQLVCDFLLRL